MSLASFSRFERFLDQVVPALFVGIGLWVSAAVAVVSL